MRLNNKGKAATIVISVMIVVSLIIGGVIVYNSNTGKDTQPETVSKRVKLDVKEKATETAQTPAQGQKTAAPQSASTAQKAATAAPDVKQPSKEATAKPIIAAKSAVPAVKGEAAKPAEPLKAETKPGAVKEAAKPPVRVASKPEPKKASLLNKPFALNLASFISDREAQDFKKSLKKAGYKAYVTSIKKDDVTWYRVRAGFFKTEADAKIAGKNIAGKFKLENEPWITRPTKAEISLHSK